jgi:hypothetical protein
MFLWWNTLLFFHVETQQFTIETTINCDEWTDSNTLSFVYDFSGKFLSKTYQGSQTFKGMTIEETHQYTKERNAQTMLHYIGSISALKDQMQKGVQQIDIVSFEEEHQSVQELHISRVGFYLNDDKEHPFDFIYHHGKEEGNITYMHYNGFNIHLSPDFFPFRHEIITYIKKQDKKTRLHFFGK